jgi:hypothetical protein
LDEKVSRLDRRQPFESGGHPIAYGDGCEGETPPRLQAGNLADLRAHGVLVRSAPEINLDGPAAGIVSIGRDGGVAAIERLRQRIGEPARGCSIRQTRTPIFDRTGRSCSTFPPLHLDKRRLVDRTIRARLSLTALDIRAVARAVPRRHDVLLQYGGSESGVSFEVIGRRLWTFTLLQSADVGSGLIHADCDAGYSRCGGESKRPAANVTAITVQNAGSRQRFVAWRCVAEAMNRKQA